MKPPFLTTSFVQKKALAAASPETLKAPLAATVAEKLALDLLKGGGSFLVNEKH